MDHPDPTEILQRTIALATANVADGGGPFGAVVRLPDGELVEGVNRVTASNDPTAHAEVAAIREACARTRSPDLRGAVLYASCEPCPMCLAAALWARLDLVVFAAGRGDAARAGFDDSAFYDYFARPGHHAVLPVEQHRHADAVDPFDAWLAHEGRTAY